MLTEVKVWLHRFRKKMEEERTLVVDASVLPLRDELLAPLRYYMVTCDSKGLLITTELLGRWLVS